MHLKTYSSQTSSYCLQVASYNLSDSSFSALLQLISVTESTSILDAEVGCVANLGVILCNSMHADSFLSV